MVYQQILVSVCGSGWCILRRMTDHKARDFSHILFVISCCQFLQFKLVWACKRLVILCKWLLCSLLVDQRTGFFNIHSEKNSVIFSFFLYLEFHICLVSASASWWRQLAVVRWWCHRKLSLSLLLVGRTELSESSVNAVVTLGKTSRTVCWLRSTTHWPRRKVCEHDDY